MECEKDVLEILDILFNSGLIRGKRVFEDDIKHLISHKKSNCSDEDILNLTKMYLKTLGIIVVKGNYENEKTIKLFDDGSYIVETVYGVEYDILNNDEIIGRIIFYEDRVIIEIDKEEKEYKMNRTFAIKALKDFISRYNNLKDFLVSYTRYLEENNDERTIQWLKDFLSSKS